jgi:RNA recognition motif. (a.k.a. RRM, RBD, or RNP domain)
LIWTNIHLPLPLFSPYLFFYQSTRYDHQVTPQIRILMSYPPPPGTTNSLPPRPPPPAKSSGRNYAPAPFVGFAPRSVAAQSSGTRNSNSTVVSAGPQPATASYQAGPASYGPHAPSQWDSSYYGGASQGASADYATGPAIRNPFAPPTASSNLPAYDPEMEAQIAQWQSAYVPKDAAKSGGVNYNPLPPSGSSTKPDNSGPLKASDIASAVSKDRGVANVITGSDGSRKTVVRSGGGATWTDTSLLEWDPTHFRIFVGNLAGEVTDESLLKAFSRFKSVQKARVVRDKRTTKSKGYGFVSFKDGDDYFQAAKEMQGKYIGSHPVLIKKSTTEIKAVTSKDKKRGKGGGGGGGGGGGYGGKNGGGGGQGGGGGYLGANTGAGVSKKGKTKGGLKLLG